MPNTYDAIVIGGGHNGLISAGFFAKGGARTVVLESRDRTGGAADTSAPWPEHPDFRVSTYSYVMSLMPLTVIRELARAPRLQRDAFGPYYQAFPDGRLDQDLHRRRREELRVDLAVLQEGRRDHAGVGRVAVRRRRRQAPPPAGTAQGRPDAAARPRRHAEDGMEGEGASACAAWATSRACSRCR